MENQEADSKSNSTSSELATIDQILEIENFKWEWYKFIVNMMNGLPAVRAYANAYGIDLNPETNPIANKQYCVAASSGHALLKNPKFIEFRRSYLKTTGWNTEAVDGVTLEIMFDRSQPATARLAAVDQYNKINGRHVKKVQHSGTIRNENVNMPDGADDVLNDIKSRELPKSNEA